MALSEASIRRYSRQILLREVGGRGQERLLCAEVCVRGAGPALAPVCLYLAGAGVGCLRLSECGVVEASDVGAWVFRPGDVGRPRASVVADAVGERHPDVRVLIDSAADGIDGDGIDVTGLSVGAALRQAVAWTVREIG